MEHVQLLEGRARPWKKLEVKERYEFFNIPESH